MSSENEKKYTWIPEIGRGCSFNNQNFEPQARINPGCQKLKEEPWMAPYPDNIPTNIFEVRFKNTRRSFFINANNLQLKIGDIVAVEASPGHDIGIISLTGDMVAKQMRRVGFNPYNGEYKKIYRIAKPYDIEKWQEAIALEHETMIRSRQIAADMGLNMKIGDVEYQGDRIKAIFYYIADERVDFRELIKVFAEQFHIRIEMKQIGARQEAGRIGGIGACGRELCCSSWISTFSSVTTGAARMQELSLNPQKLAGQCSKLKCCMTYEYDTYVDARKEFPRLREPLQTIDGEFHLVKSDILARTMTFSSSKDVMANVVTIPVSRVKEIIHLNRGGTKVESLMDSSMKTNVVEPTYRAEEDSITRFDSSRKRNNNNRKPRKPRNADNKNADSQQESKPAQEGQSDRPKGGRRGAPRPNNRANTERPERSEQATSNENKPKQKPNTQAAESAPKPRREGPKRPPRPRPEGGDKEPRGERPNPKPRQAAEGGATPERSPKPRQEGGENRANNQERKPRANRGPRQNRPPRKEKTQE